MTPNRPDPDALLAQVQQDEAREHRGRLKVFFGSAAGVGKTCTMLEAGRAQLAAGLDVLIGLIETHGRSETALLASHLPRLPVRRVPYRGTELKEFDLDAALARKPALILVDELAHTNAPGSRHVKRWQDVDELLDAGIDVYTTLNVQHLESLNDVVGRITGIRVSETLPDWVFAEADEVELVDLPVDELLTRLAEGKVYIAEQAERAASHFFRKGNLIALRELALRRTADRVDAQMHDYRRRAAIGDVWQVAERLIVAIGPHDGERLVRAGKRLAEPLRAEWWVVYVETPAHALSGEAEVAAAMKLAESLGAQVQTLTGHEVAEELVNFARSHNAARIMLGHASRRRRFWQRPTLSARIALLADDVDITLIAKKPQESAALSAWLAASRDYLGVEHLAALRKQRSGTLAWGLGLPALVTALAWPVREMTAPINLIMVYLLVVVIAAYRYGHGAAVLASIASVAAFDFFFVPPFLTFAVSDTQYLFTFAVMLGVALTISRLTANIRRQALLSGFRERRTALMYELVQALVSEQDEAGVMGTAVKRLNEHQQAQAVILLPDANGRLGYPKGDSIMGSLHGADLGVAQWVFERGEAAGLGTATLPGADALYLPLAGAEDTLGVLAVRPRGEDNLTLPDERRLLDAFAAQVALALERVRLSRDNEAVQIASQGEKLRNSLLTSISHDLRSPLAGIVGAASTLAERDLPPDQRRQLAEGIEAEAERMTRLVASVLDMARLEAGAMPLIPEWLPIEEAFGAAIHALGPRLAEHPLATRLPPGLPLVYADSTLLERVLVNLLENAVKYTPAGSRLMLSAEVAAAGVTLYVDDTGPGLGVEDPDSLFEKFQRARPEDNAGGVGLGLAICRAIVEAHGGNIKASRRAEGGTRFSVFLPSPGEPPYFTPEEN
ncbi:sensor histidine kinase [Crenobacter cavernae]|uniref:histidine kinase n=1 Tax=Crenobacter cavernae TaxID=2290923 RepID=A0ABY0FHY2_9NEIS|nr:sensor histidine kinase KdpD [Crenobacter cavernae]RXZ45096.1 sensor histidine kinase KdpD [Crenobacter cavernae]